ncbi:MAG: alpha/beta fold hydrolase [Propionibacteriales bacterium]|nr:alpha/beta fold hydrolase [Propionibacteriales bacterium]
MTNGDRIVQANGVDICVETFGDPADAALVLIGGLAASMDWWQVEFCELLAAGDRFVIRYDHRDTGRSVSYPPNAPTYTGADLFEDAVGLLDTLGVDRAHVVGLSAGGGIAQELALGHPDRVASLTLMSTSPVEPVADLPPMTDELKAVFEAPSQEPDWSDREAVVDYMVDGERPFNGSLPFDEAGVRETAGRMVDRTVNIQSAVNNHWILDHGGDAARPLAELTTPTLVFHGTADPLFPFGHALALVGLIPGARLVTLEQVGHQYPPRAVWGDVVPAILDHTSHAD